MARAYLINTQWLAQERTVAQLGSSRLAAGGSAKSSFEFVPLWVGIASCTKCPATLPMHYLRAPAAAGKGVRAECVLLERGKRSLLLRFVCDKGVEHSPAAGAG